MKRMLYFSLCCLFSLIARAANAPSNLSATGASSSQINLAWTDNSSDETGFTFAFDTNSALTNPTYVYAGGVNTTSYSHTGRSAATTYWYKIKAEGNPDSTWTAITGGTTAPSGLGAAAASNNTINLNWTANGANSAITGYTYAYATNSSFTGATYVYVNGNGSASTSRAGLSTATTYWFKLKAEGTSDALDSPFGSVVPTTTTPASLAASAASTSQINVTWSGNSGNANIVGYTVAAATNSAFSGAVYQYVAGAGSTSYSHTGLAPGTTVYYKIKAEGTSDAYDSAYTAATTATTSSAAPNAPSNLSASVISSSQINLTWTDNSTNETGFEVKRATDSAFTQNVTWIGGIQGASYSNTGLASSTTYYYKVRAEGTTQDSAYSNVVSATTSAATIPQAPSNLDATAVSNTQINLTWTDNSSNETGFEVKRATDSGFTQNVTWIGGITGTSYSNVGLNPSTTYYYAVRAEGTAGKSAYSASDSATTTGNPPPTGVPITPYFFGNNAWMPEYVGRVKKWGKLKPDPSLSIWQKVQDSGMRIMRYGGHAVDFDANPFYSETLDQYVAMVETMRAKNIVPVLQVPVGNGAYTPQQAADIVRHVNFSGSTRLERAVDYWVIGNEPDLDYTGGTSAANIAPYLRAFSAAMKAADPSIKIIGPELSWYRPEVMEDLAPCYSGEDTTHDVTGTDPSTGRTYVDIMSFHSYSFDTTQSSRSTVIGKLTSSGGFQQRLGELRDRLAQCDSVHQRTVPLRMAVTEANINYVPSSIGTDNNMTLGAKSFMGGQYWAEMMGIAMRQGVDFITFWSVIEGSGLSYISSDESTLWPTWYHFQMMSQHFRGSAVDATEGLTNVKAFAAADTDQTVVLLMNQETSTSYSYTVRLGSGTVSGTRPLKVSVAAGSGVEYNSTTDIAPESTVLLVFNASGTLTKRITYASGGTPQTVTY